MTRVTRRRALTGIAAGALTLKFAGIASADGQTRYVARARGNRTASRIEDAGFEIENELADGEVLLVVGPDDSLDALQSVHGVQNAVFDFRFEIDEPLPKIEAEGIEPEAAFEANLWDNDLLEARSAHDEATGAGTKLAIIDTGIDDTHPDLGVDVDESVSIIDGVIDDHAGDIQGHGTHVAGIAAATGAVGVVGIAPEAELVSIRVFEGETASFADILLAISYAADIGADAANMSIGTAPIPPQGNAEQYRGVMEPVAQHATGEGTVLVGSAGNSDANLQHGGFFTLPNSLQGILSTSATAPDDERAYYSNYGTNEIDVGAPGGGYGNLEKTLCGYEEWLDAGAPPLIDLDPREPGDTGTLWLDEDGVPTTNPAEVAESVDCEIPEWPVPFNFVFATFPGGGYAWLAGTSMAAPQVAGAAALVRETNPDANPNQVENALKQGADLVRGRNDPDLGAGRLNAANTVDEA